QAGLNGAAAGGGVLTGRERKVHQHRQDPQSGGAISRRRKGTTMIVRDFHYYEPAEGHGLSHNPLNALVAPRPIGWISSRDAQGRVNLAPYSFFNAFNYDPPIIGFSSIAWKD